MKFNFKEIKKITKLLREKGNTYSTIAEELNKQGFTTASGKTFTSGNLHLTINKRKNKRSKVRESKDSTSVFQIRKNTILAILSDPLISDKKALNIIQAYLSNG